MSGSLQHRFCCLPANERCRPSSTLNISGLNPFTHTHCGLISPAGGFAYFVAAISAPYGNRLACQPCRILTDWIAQALLGALILFLTLS